MNPNDDLFAPVAPTQSAPADGYVLCEFDGACVAIPHADVLTIEHGGELAAALPAENVVGWFESPQGPWPVQALGSQLRLLQQTTGSRSYIAFIKPHGTAHTWPIGLLCDSVRITGRREELARIELPLIMIDPAQAIVGVARLAPGRIALIFGDGKIGQYLQHRLDALTPATSDPSEIAHG